MRIIITGASGFIGRNLIAYLKERRPDVGVDIIGRTTEINWDNVTAGCLRGADAIVHLAGKAHDISDTNTADLYFEVNYGLTKKLYDLFLQSDARKFVYISSVKAAADTVPGMLTEDVIPEPLTPYGQSKLKAEEYIISRSGACTGEDNGKSYYILRPCMVHGPHNKGNLNLLYRFVSNGVPYPLAAFENRRSFLGIDNLCFIIQGLLERPVASGIYNVADDTSLATKDLITIMAEARNRKPRLWSISKDLVKFVAGIGDKFNLPLNSERLKKLTESYIVSNARIKKALKIDQLPVSSREGLLRTIRSFGQPGRD